MCVCVCVETPLDTKPPLFRLLFEVKLPTPADKENSYPPPPSLCVFSSSVLLKLQSRKVSLFWHMCTLPCMRTLSPLSLLQTMLLHNCLQWQLSLQPLIICITLLILFYPPLSPTVQLSFTLTATIKTFESVLWYSSNIPVKLLWDVSFAYYLHSTIPKCITGLCWLLLLLFVVVAFPSHKVPLISQTFPKMTLISTVAHAVFFFTDLLLVTSLSPLT